MVCAVFLFCYFELNKSFRFWGDYFLFWQNHVKFVFVETKKKTQKQMAFIKIVTRLIRPFIASLSCVVIAIAESKYRMDRTFFFFCTCLNQGHFNIRETIHCRYAVNFVQWILWLLLFSFYHLNCHSCNKNIYWVQTIALTNNSHSSTHKLNLITRFVLVNTTSVIKSFSFNWILFGANANKLIK